MSSNGEASGSASGSFSNFWQRSTDKLASKKFKFVPGIAKPDENDNEQVDSATAALTAKQHRRAQVRKAQIEHRQRKAHYAKHLEQDVIDLREMIATAETEAILCRQENEAIRAAMLNANIPISIPDTQLQLPPAQSDPLALPHLAHPPLTINTAMSQGRSQAQIPQPLDDDLSWLSEGSGSSVVSTIFDELLSQTILKVSPGPCANSGPRSSPRSGNSPHVRNGSSHSFAHGRSPSSGPPQRRRGSSVLLFKKEEVDVSTFAVNFILALEHPCRTHFQHQTPDFDPVGSPSGHELLASTLLYTSAPTPVFPALSAAVPVPTWTDPHSSAQTLKSLEEMARVLPKNDWEITPVQAWFMMIGRYGVEKVVNGDGVERLRRGLSELVDCFAFGAVMDEQRFWGVVGEILGEDAAKGPEDGLEWI